MDLSKVDLVLQFALAVAAQEDEYAQRELGPIHLLKYVYLADLAFARRHGGETFTGTAWKFYHFGPWSPEVFGRIAPATTSIHARERRFESDYRDEDAVRYSTSPQLLDESFRWGSIPMDVKLVVKWMVHTYGSDTTSLLHHVYQTEPMLNAAPNEILDFSVASPKVADKPASILPSEVPGRKAEKRALDRREEVQARIRERRKARQNAETPPVYDEIYANGMCWLDTLAGASIESEEGTMTVSDDLWKNGDRGPHDG